MQQPLSDSVAVLISNPVFYIHIIWVLLMGAAVVFFLYQLHNLSDPDTAADRRRMAWIAGAATVGVMNFGLPTYWAL